MFEPDNAIYKHSDIRKLLTGKTTVVMGDSIQRSVYKDLVCLFLQADSRYLYESELRKKGEKAFQKDSLLRGGEFVKGSSGLDEYREVREYKEGSTVFRFYFLTRCYNDYMESVMNEFKTLKPHVLVVNSCYWDIHRYGEQGKLQYKPNLEKLFKAASELPEKPLFIWSSALPLAKYCKGGFLRQGFKTLPLEDIITANRIAREAVNKYNKGFYLDLYNSLPNNHIFEQASDGIHWGHRAHRKMSNSILSVISSKWGKIIPTLEPEIPIGQQFLAQGPNPWPYYPEDSLDEYYEEEYENEYENWDNQFYQPPWENRPNSPFLPPFPMGDGLLPMPGFSPFGFNTPKLWGPPFPISPNDRYLEFSESPPPPLMHPLTPGNARRPPHLHQRHFSDPLPRYLPRDDQYSYGFGFFNAPQPSRSNYKNRFKQKSGRNKRAKSTSGAPYSRHHASSMPRAVDVSARNTSVATGASPILPSRSTNSIKAVSNGVSVSESATNAKTTDTNNNVGQALSKPDSVLVKESANKLETPSEVSAIIGRKRKRDEEEDNQEVSSDAPPKKQAICDLVSTTSVSTGTVTVSSLPKKQAICEVESATLAGSGTVTETSPSKKQISCDAALTASVSTGTVAESCPPKKQAICEVESATPTKKQTSCEVKT